MTMGDHSEMKVSKVRSDLDDIQQRLRPRNHNHQHKLTRFDEQSDGAQPTRETQNEDDGVPPRQNTTDGIVSKQDVGQLLFGKPQEMV